MSTLCVVEVVIILMVVVRGIVDGTIVIVLILMETSLEVPTPNKYVLTGRDLMLCPQLESTLVRSLMNQIVPQCIELT